MANQRIRDLAFDTNEANLSRNDEVIIRRNNVNYRARINGGLFLPPATSADANSSVKVNASGAYYLEAAPAGNSSTQLFVTPENPSVPYTFPAGTLTGYRMFHLTVRMGFSNGSRTRGLWVRPDSAATYSEDGEWRAWFPNSTSINITPPTGEVVEQIRLYGIR